MAQPTAKRITSLNYISLDLNNSNINQNSPTTIKTEYTEILPPQPMLPNLSPAKQHDLINLQSHTPEKSGNHNRRDLKSFDQAKLNNVDLSSKFNEFSYVSAHSNKMHLLKTNERIDKIETDNGNEDRVSPTQFNSTSKNIDERFQRLSLEKYDYLMGNAQLDLVDNLDSEGAHYIKNTPHVENLGVANRIKQMQELGVPPDEILEIDRRITQQERDEVSFNYNL